MHQEFTMFLVVRHLTRRLAEYIQKCGEDIKGFARIAVTTGFEQLAPAYLVGVQRLRAILHECKRPHVVIGTDHQPAQRVHQREVAIASVTRAEKIFDQSFEPLVPETLVQVRKELVFFPWADIIQIVVGARLLQERIILGVVRRTGVVEHDRPDRMSIEPKVFIILFDGFPDVAQSISRDYKKEIFFSHASLNEKYRESSLQLQAIRSGVKK